MYSHIFLALSSGVECPEVVQKVLANTAKQQTSQDNLSYKIMGSLDYMTASQRYQNLLKAFQEKPQYLWSVRGGFDVSSVLYLLEKNKISAPQKTTLVGYSDITILHLWMRKNQKGCVHGIMPYMSQQAYALHHRKTNYKSAFHFKPFPRQAYSFEVLYNPQKVQKSTTTLIGGNLTSLHSQLGTPTQMQGEGQVIFFEDDHYTSKALVKKNDSRADIIRSF